MPNLQRVREITLDRIRPTQSEIDEGHRIFSKVQLALQQKAKAEKVELAFIELEGSAGIKQTQIRGRHELDIFVGLPPSALFSNTVEPPSKAELRLYFRKLVKEVALEAINEVGGSLSSISYAEHPYISATLNDYNLDVVFCVDLTPEYIAEKGPVTAVDRTPHHSRFVDSHLSSTQRDDVRLLKAFLLSTFVYGDSSPVGRSGFTGFSTEMLIFYTKSLEDALDFLRDPTSDPLDYFDRSSRDLKELFKHDQLIIVDPTDSNRNIASSISDRSCRYTAVNADKLLANPDPMFFSMEPIPVLSPEQIENLGKHYYVIEFQDETGWHYTKTRDKLYSYFTKLRRFLSKEPTGEPRFGIVVFELVFQHPAFAVALYIENFGLSRSFIRKGPRSKYELGVEEFKKKHPDAYLKNGQYQAKVPRAFRSIDDALLYYLSNYQISAKLHLTDLTHFGTTIIGRQALWILTQAVLPYEPLLFQREAGT